jgi:hypothetical protein
MYIYGNITNPVAQLIYANKAVKTKKSKTENKKLLPSKRNNCQSKDSL